MTTLSLDGIIYDLVGKMSIEKTVYRRRFRSSWRYTVGEFPPLNALFIGSAQCTRKSAWVNSKSWWFLLLELPIWGDGGIPPYRQLAWKPTVYLFLSNGPSDGQILFRLIYFRYRAPLRTLGNTVSTPRKVRLRFWSKSGKSSPTALAFSWSPCRYSYVWWRISQHTNRLAVLLVRLCLL